MKDLYQQVTDRIVTSLEAGVPPWICPWQPGSDGIHKNITSHKPYRGINVLLLNLQAMSEGYPDTHWLTYKQAIELGAHVRKGEAGTSIVFFKFREIEDDKAEADRKVVPMLRTYTVFNTAQTEGLPERYLQAPPEQHWTPCEAAEGILMDSGASIWHGGNRAFYAPADDVIQLPPVSYFPEADGYYGTALHELTHWTGHPDRCNRPLGRRHGIDAYAYEELVAEMGAAFLCAHCQLPARLEHASYIDTWLDALKKDKRLIFVAAGAAQKAADYALGISHITPVAEALAA